MVSKLVAFLRDVKIELARVNWPSRKQTTQYTLAVIVMSLVVAAFLGALDAVFSFILNKFILK
jgi:preprotein translocase subunit SecE